jgi:hypothetical protein
MVYDYMGANLFPYQDKTFKLTGNFLFSLQYYLLIPYIFVLNKLNLSVFIFDINANGKKKDAYKKNGCTPECASNNGLEAMRGGDPPRG